MEKQDVFEYEEKGQVVNTLLTYTIGFGLVIVIVIFMTVLGSKVYESQQTDIAAISEAAIKGDVNSSIVGAFESMETFASNLDIISIAVVFGVALIVILAAFGAVGIAGVGRGGGFSAI